jgi:hypothetical protein
MGSGVKKPRRCTGFPARKQPAPSQKNILPVFGDLRIDEIVPLQVERFIQTKVESGLSGKTVRNLLLVLQGIMSLALDNDLIDRSPIRNIHKPTIDKHETSLSSKPADG